MATSVDFDPFRTEDLANPYPLYAELRESAPVAFNARLNGWLVTRYADVKHVLRDATAFSSRIRTARSPAHPDLRELAPHHLTPVMSTSDRPRHTELRALATKTFKRTTIEQLRPRIERMFDELVDRATAKAEIDVIAELASPLPKRLIVSMMGLPPIEHDRFQRWTDDAVSPVTSLTAPEHAARIERSYHEFIAYARSSAADYRRTGATDGLLGALHAGHDAGVITEDELVSHLLLILVAGNETSTGLLGFVILTLLKHPDQLEELLRDPSLIPVAMEELLRWDGTVNQYTVRVATEDVELGGAHITAGDRVLPCMASANRDERVFRDAERFDLHRTPNDHLALGTHIHSCIGAPLARFELEIFLERVVPRLTGMRLAVPEEALVYRPSYRARSLDRLPIAGTWCA